MSSGIEATYLIGGFIYLKNSSEQNKATVMIMRYNSKKEL